MRAVLCGLFSSWLDLPPFQAWPVGRMSAHPAHTQGVESEPRKPLKVKLLSTPAGHPEAGGSGRAAAGVQPPPLSNPVTAPETPDAPSEPGRPAWFPLQGRGPTFQSTFVHPSSHCGLGVPLRSVPAGDPGLQPLRVPGPSCSAPLAHRGFQECAPCWPAPMPCICPTCLLQQELGLESAPPPCPARPHPGGFPNSTPQSHLL